MFALLYFCQGNFSKFLIFFTYFRGDFFFFTCETMWIFFPRWIYFHVRNRLKETFLWEKKLQKKLCFTGALEYSPAKTSFSIGFTLFTHNFFQLTKKKVVWNLWYRVNLLEKSAFWSCIYFFHPDQKRKRKTLLGFTQAEKNFNLEKNI